MLLLLIPARPLLLRVIGAAGYGELQILAGFASALGAYALFDAVGFTLPNSGLTLVPRTVVVSLAVGILVSMGVVGVIVAEGAARLGDRLRQGVALASGLIGIWWIVARI